MLLRYVALSLAVLCQRCRGTLEFRIPFDEFDVLSDSELSSEEQKISDEFIHLYLFISMLFFAVLLLATAAYLIVYLRNYILIPYKRLNRMIHAVESQLRQQQMETETERKYFNKIGFGLDKAIKERENYTQTLSKLLSKISKTTLESMSTQKSKDKMKTAAEKEKTEPTLGSKETTNLNDPLTNIEIVQEGYEPVVPIVVEPEVVMEGYEPVVPTDTVDLHTRPSVLRQLNPSKIQGPVHKTKSVHRAAGSKARTSGGRTGKSKPN